LIARARRKARTMRAQSEIVSFANETCVDV